MTDTSFSSIKKFFSSSPSLKTGTNAVNGLPFTYVDANHTSIAPPPKVSSWLPSWNSPSLSGIANRYSTETSWWETMGLSRIQRYTAFGICLIASILLALLAMMNLPFIAFSPRKFVVPYCFASLLLAFSFGFIHGFVSYAHHLIAPDRRWLSLTFYGLTFITLYVSIAIRSYIYTIILSILQGISMTAYILSYLPGGRSGISAVASMASGSLMPSF